LKFPTEYSSSIITVSRKFIKIWLLMCW
jgi:hypothetical protein